LKNQIVLFPKNASEPPPITEAARCGDNKLDHPKLRESKLRVDNPSVELETSALRENQIWRDSQNGGWGDNFELSLPNEEDNDGYNWDQPDIQSEKIARRFAAKNTEKIAES